MIKKFSALLNHCLPKNPEIESCLKRLSQKTLALTIEPFNRTIYIHINDGHCEITETTPEKVDVTLSGTPFAFMGLARGSKGLGNVHMTGDAEIGMDFRKLLDPTHLDWEEGLSTILGDVWSYRLMEAGRKGLNLLKRTANIFGQDVTEYVQEEAQVLPSKHQLDTFYSDVTQLSHDAERLNIRLKRIVS